jgi:RNA polymerase sigma-70 factor (ECF subfamily)
VGLMKKGNEHLGIPDGSRFDVEDVNGWPSLVVRHDGRAIFCLGLETDGERIHSVFVVVAPDKLSRI